MVGAEVFVFSHVHVACAPARPRCTTVPLLEKRNVPVKRQQGGNGSAYRNRGIAAGVDYETD